jgi:hypothetical protein
LPVLAKKNKLPEIDFMEKKYYSLETRDDNRVTKIFRIIFGLMCCAIAVFWITFRFISVRTDSTQWITISFLMLFGIFQILAGMGLAVKFIEIYADKIKLKQNSVLPAIELLAENIERIELYPLKVIFYILNDKKILLRFGISNPDNVELLKEEIIKFADSNKLTLELMSE